MRFRQRPRGPHFSAHISGSRAIMEAHEDRWILCLLNTMSSNGLNSKFSEQGVIFGLSAKPLETYRITVFRPSVSNAVSEDPLDIFF